ncbi:MAG: RnfABCDGE type electron transport complex subunit B [Planctomycetaceae bacterium]|nr:RnfABCDGE type electron transport complex subunit B [Planctomycetaceae bacterium]
MAIIMILLAAGTMLVLALAAGFVLGWANKALHVQADPRIESILSILPGANCGGCEFIGCADYAEALVKDGAAINKCSVGGESCKKMIANILGVEVTESWPYRPVVHCGAHTGDKFGRHLYQGEGTCSGANGVAGVQGCTYGCLAFGDCERSCNFDAIHVVDGLATVDYHKCTGCGACERACPRHIISMVPFKRERMLVVTCCNHDFGKAVKAVCKVGCIGCGACARTSALFSMEKNLPRIDYEKYDPEMAAEFETLMGKCPMKRLLIIGKPTERDLAGVANEKNPPDLIVDKFETTADKTEWRG